MDFVFVSGILILVSLISLWIRRRKERLSIFKRNGIPGPEPNFWLGNYKDVAEKRDACVAEYVKKYGSIVGFFFGPKPLLIVTDEELMKRIQVKEFIKFSDRDMLLRDGGVPQPEFMEAMPAVHGEEWKKKRSLVSPLFSTSKLKRLMPIMNEATDIFMEKLQKATYKECINIVEILSNLTLDIITKVALGIDTGVQHTAKSDLLSSAKLFFSMDNTDILLALSFCLPELEPIPTMVRNIRDTMRNRLGLPSVKTIFNHVRKVMDYRRKYSQRREDMLQGLMDEKSDLKRLLSVKYEELVASEDNKAFEKVAGKTQDVASNTNETIALPDDSIVGTATILLVAGYDTTSLVLSYLVYYLAKHQNVQDKLREEINTQLAGKKNIEYEDLLKLPYLEQVLAETLRLHPTGMLSINRVVQESFEYNGMTIPKGVTVIFPSYFLQRNPEKWSNPDEFRPERFAPENKSKITPYVYQPFGNGPRNCVGMRFAQINIKLILTRMIQSYKIEDHGKDLVLDLGLFLNHPKEVMVKLIAIQH